MTDDQRQFWAIIAGVKPEDIISVKRVGNTMIVLVDSATPDDLEVDFSLDEPDTLMGHPVVYV